MDLTKLQYLSTDEVKTKEDVGTATRLSIYYNYVPMLGKKLEKLISSDWWSSCELLSDIIQDPKSGEEWREAVATLILTEVNLRKRSNRPLSDLFVECFAHSQWYDPEIAVRWADHRISQAIHRLNRIDKVLWYVDERNVPLQVELRNIGWKITNYDSTKEIMVFSK